jgi:hypothetical protein
VLRLGGKGWLLKKKMHKEEGEMEKGERRVDRQVIKKNTNGITDEICQ